MEMPQYIMLISGMLLATYIPRWLPLDLLAQKELPLRVKEWLDLIPAAILSALIFPLIFSDSATGNYAVMHKDFLVAIPTFLIALKTRSLGISVISGMALYWFAGII